jgi:formate hydrogenlyase subunit 4
MVSILAALATIIILASNTGKLPFSLWERVEPGLIRRKCLVDAA